MGVDAPTVLFVADEWSPSKGGVSVVNQELCVALASLGVGVACYVMTADREDADHAHSRGVALLTRTPGAFLSPRENFVLGPERSLSATLRLVVGHGGQSGQFAHEIRARQYATAALLHIIHVDHDELEIHKEHAGHPGVTDGVDSKKSAEDFLIRDADLVAAVGPILVKAKRNKCNSFDRRLVQLLPGLPTKQSFNLAPTFPSFLCRARTQDIKAKGLDVAVRALSRLAKELTSEVILHVRGSPPGQEDAIRTALQRITREPLLKIRVLAFSTDGAVLDAELRDACALLMPSRVESFGLVGLEALAVGIPAFVSEQSGLGVHLRSLNDGLGRPFLVDVPNNRNASRSLTERVLAFWRDRNHYCEKAAELREHLGATMTWKHTAVQLLQDLRDAEIDLGPSQNGGSPPTQPAPPTPPSTPANHCDSENRSSLSPVGASTGPGGDDGPVDVTAGGVDYLGEHGLGTQPEQDDDSESTRIVREAKRISEEVIDWPATLPDGTLIPRPELERVDRWLDGDESRVLVLFGEGGSGKSSLLAIVARRLAEAKRPILAMRLDRMGRSVISDVDFSNYLGLSVSVVDGVRSLGSRGPVVVIIDQLDALCDLMGERAGRLGLVLSTIEHLAMIEKVRVVIAARPFEFRHDVRLRGVDLTEVTLALPAWDDINDHVRNAGIVSELIPDDLREELRRPQVLRTFLQLVASGSDWRALKTYQAMREVLWQTEIAGSPSGPRREELLYRIADAMAADEVLTVPLASLECPLDLINSLESAGWLSRVGLSGIAFRHQSLFDFAYARSVSREGGRILALVASHQGLFARRRVSHVLAYLRESSFEHYVREFEALWMAPDVRRHMKHLLIEFVGQVRDPRSVEVEWMRRALRDHAWRVHALLAARRGPTWCRALSEIELPAAMRDPELRSACAGILLNAGRDDVDLVATLVENNWSRDEEAAPNAAWVLNSLKPWSDDVVRVAVRVAERLRLHLSRHLIEELVLAALEKSANDAALVLAAALDADVRHRLEHRAATRESKRPARSASMEEQAQWHLESDRRDDPIRDLFEGGVYWTGLRRFAEQAPAAFLRAVWPAMSRALGAIAQSETIGPSYLTELSREPAEAAETVSAE